MLGKEKMAVLSLLIACLFVGCSVSNKFSSQYTASQERNDNTTEKAEGTSAPTEIDNSTSVQTIMSDSASSPSGDEETPAVLKHATPSIAPTHASTATPKVQAGLSVIIRDGEYSTEEQKKAGRLKDLLERGDMKFMKVVSESLAEEDVRVMDISQESLQVTIGKEDAIDGKDAIVSKTSDGRFLMPQFDDSGKVVSFIVSPDVVDSQGKQLSQNIEHDNLRDPITSSLIRGARLRSFDGDIDMVHVRYTGGNIDKYLFTTPLMTQIVRETGINILNARKYIAELDQMAKYCEVPDETYLEVAAMSQSDFEDLAKEIPQNVASSKVTEGQMPIIVKSVESLLLDKGAPLEAKAMLVHYYKKKVGEIFVYDSNGGYQKDGDIFIGTRSQDDKGYGGLAHELVHAEEYFILGRATQYGTDTMHREWLCMVMQYLTAKIYRDYILHDVQTDGYKG